MRQRLSQHMKINILCKGSDFLNDMTKFLDTHPTGCSLILYAEAAGQITGIRYLYIDSFQSHTFFLSKKFHPWWFDNHRCSEFHLTHKTVDRPWLHTVVLHSVVQHAFCVLFSHDSLPYSLLRSFFSVVLHRKAVYSLREYRTCARSVLPFAYSWKTFS